MLKVFIGHVEIRDCPNVYKDIYVVAKSLSAAKKIGKKQVETWNYTLVDIYLEEIKTDTPLIEVII